MKSPREPLGDFIYIPDLQLIPFNVPFVSKTGMKGLVSLTKPGIKKL